MSLLRVWGASSLRIICYEVSMNVTWCLDISLPLWLPAQHKRSWQNFPPTLLLLMKYPCGYWPKEPPIPWVCWFWTLICWPTIPTPKTGFFWFFVVVFSNLFSLDWIASAFFFSYLLDLLIYLWLCWVFVAACGLSLDAESGGCSLLWCPGFSLRRLLFLPSRGSRRASVVASHRPSICHTACEIFQEQRSNSCPLHWQVGS